MITKKAVVRMRGKDQIKNNKIGKNIKIFINK